MVIAPDNQMFTADQCMAEHEEVAISLAQYW